MKNKLIYICDDEQGMLRYLGKMLASRDYGTEVFASPLDLLDRLRDPDSDEEPAMLLLDIRMPEMDGIDALRKVREIRQGLPVVIMTGHGTIESAVEAMKLGAYDYLTKPFPKEKLFAVVEHCLETEQLRSENTALKKELRTLENSEMVMSASPAFQKAWALAMRVASSDSNVLITGESGTGKEVVARAVHRASDRATHRFLAVNCAALTETLLESQLFGHLKGAFTGATQNQQGILEEAHEGTLFLDEIGDVSPALQAKLLRALQQGEYIPVGSTQPRRVDVRFIAATNRRLEAEVAAGRFREDLYYRLNVITIDLPPLRERPEDIEALAEHFLARASSRLGVEPSALSSEALKALRTYTWPGNVRELQNVIERGAILAENGRISADVLPLKVLRPPTPSASETGVLPLRESERLQILRALRETRWNKSQAAGLLGITRKTLDRKIKEYALDQSMTRKVQ